MIVLKNISVTFNVGMPIECLALNEINLRIHEGEFVTVIGGNGSGKSTLMNLIAGEVHASNGSILINNLNVTKWDETKRAIYVSRVFQDPLIGSCADLTIAENMELAFLRGKGKSLRLALNKGNRKYFREIVSTLGLNLENRLDYPMKQLSGGQRQAINLLMATLQPSKILLLDEHSSALDPRMSKKVMEITMKLIEEQKLTVLMVTHSMSQALDYGTRTIILQEGQIVRDISGDARKSMAPYDLLSIFEVL